MTEPYERARFLDYCVFLRVDEYRQLYQSQVRNPFVGENLSVASKRYAASLDTSDYKPSAQKVIERSIGTSQTETAAERMMPQKAEIDA